MDVEAGGNRLSNGSACLGAVVLHGMGIATLRKERNFHSLFMQIYLEVHIKGGYSQCVVDT
ncbi:hypothetical protein [Azospirillum doebereinerae]|uniref:hypothetical protein n=2 Tax=Azospirillum doebereinerae TaxID=92933 RepID=UPI000F8CAAF9